jgi:LmbE family N-acetylglucosaminyl deacetylase
MITQFKKVLILSPHTDDAELGAGGTIVKLLEQNTNVFWVVFSTAPESLPEGMKPDTLKEEFKTVLNHLSLGEDQSMICDFKVRKLHEVRQQILEILVKVRREFDPDLVIGPSLNDFHQDHQVVAHEMVRAFKNSASIISYELPWNNLNFSTQLFVKLDASHIQKKMDLLFHYQSQIVKERSYFDHEFIKGLARTRGVQVNELYAEVFEVIRWRM